MIRTLRGPSFGATNKDKDMTEEIRALLREAFASGYAAALDAGCDASADDAREQCEEFLAIIERRPA